MRDCRGMFELCSNCVECPAQVFNNSPDETAFFRSALAREGVRESMAMIQPQLTAYSFDGPPQARQCFARSVSPHRRSRLLSEWYCC